jgi:hypothetical protein
MKLDELNEKYLKPDMWNYLVGNCLDVVAPEGPPPE